MARRPPVSIDPDIDPVDEVVRDDRYNTAQDLNDALESLSGYSTGSIKGILFKVPNGGGKYETIETVYPPFNVDGMIEDLKERFGGGDYLLRIMEIGKAGIKKNIPFSIAKERASLIAPKAADDFGVPGGMFGVMMQMQSESMRMMMQQQSEAARSREAASAHQMTLIVGLATALAPVILGGREKTSELMQAIAAMQPKGDTPGSTLALLKDAKELFGGSDKTGPSGDDIADMAQGAMRMVGPMVRGAADMFRSRGAASDGAQGHDETAPVPLMLPGATPTTSADEGSAARPSRYRVLDVIRDDVLYCYARGHAPEKAADLAYDAIEAADVTDEEIAELVSAYALSANPLDELAREGLDLRARPDWANALLAELVSIHGSADVVGDDDDTGGGSGRAGDDAPDGEAGAERLA